MVLTDGLLSPDVNPINNIWSHKQAMFFSCLKPSMPNGTIRNFCGVYSAGAGEGGRVSVGQQPGARRRFPLSARPSLQFTGGDSQPCLH